VRSSRLKMKPERSHSSLVLVFNPRDLYCLIIITTVFVMLSSWLKSLRLSAGWLPTLRPSQLTWAVSLPKIGSCHPRPPLQLSLLLSYICQIFCTQPLRPAVIVCLWFSNGQSIDDDNDDEDDDDDVQLPDFSVSLTSLTQHCHSTSSHTPTSHDQRAAGNESAPIQLAQCRFPRLAISNAKM